MYIICNSVDLGSEWIRNVVSPGEKIIANLSILHRATHEKTSSIVSSEFSVITYCVLTCSKVFFIEFSFSVQTLSTTCTFSVCQSVHLVPVVYIVLSSVEQGYKSCNFLGCRGEFCICMISLSFWLSILRLEILMLELNIYV